MSNQKFLFFDMDGTLISPKTRTIPQSAINGIKQAMANGHRCFICTGRSYMMAREYFDVLEFPGIVFCNGAGIAYDGKILETRDLHPSTVQRLIDVCEALNGGFGLLTAKYAYQNEVERNRMEKNFFHRHSDLTIEAFREKRAMKHFDEYQQEPVQKIDISFQSELTADVFFSKVPEQLQTIRAGGYYASMGRTGGEITASGVTKGLGIQRVLDMFSSSVENAYGFGDSANDLEMMKVCGTGIAMGNGSEACKQMANYVTDDTDHDGIYNALKHFELI